MNVKISFDASEFQKGLRRLEQMSIDARMAAAEQIADKILGRAKDNAPVDQGFLVGDLAQTVKVYDDGAIVAFCYVPDGAQSSEYAIKMHEEKYNLGPNSLDKAAKGFSVGNKYIRRAMDDSVGDIGKIIEYEYKRRLK